MAAIQYVGSIWVLQGVEGTIRVLKGHGVDSKASATVYQDPPSALQ